MYINPFIGGVLATIFAEMAIVIAYSVTVVVKTNIEKRKRNN